MSYPYDSIKIRSSLDSATNLLEIAKYRDALLLYDTIRKFSYKAEMWKDHIEAYRGFANCNFKLANYEQALNDRKTLIEIAKVHTADDRGSQAILHNDLALSFNSIGEYDQALIHSKKALEIQLKHVEEYQATTAQILNNIGFIFNKQIEMDSARKYYLWSLNIRRKILDKNDPSIANSLSNIGTFFARKGNYAKQAKYYEKALEIFLSNYGEEHPNVATLYNNLAYAYGKKQNYDKQLLYYEQSLAIRLKVFGEKHPSVAESYHNIAGYYIQQSDFDKFLTYIKKSQRIYSRFYGNSHIKVASSYHMMGVGFERNQNFLKALEFYKKSVNIYKDKFHDEHPRLAIGYNNMAVCYAELKQWNRQKELLEKALRIRLKSLGPKHSRVASVLNNLGNHYLSTGNFDQALITLQSALISVSDNFNDNDLNANPELAEVGNKNLLLKILRNKAVAFDSLYYQNEEITNLESSVYNFELAIRTADLLRFEISPGYSRQKITEETMPLYEGAIQKTIRLYKITRKEQYLEKALEISEKSKVFQLRLTLQESEAKQFAQIPDSLLVLETGIKEKITSLQKALDKAKQKKDTLKTLSLKEKIWKQNNAFSELTTYLEKTYPNYHKLKFDQKTASIKSIREDILDDQSTLIEYFFGKHALYMFQLSRSNLKVIEIPIDSTMIGLIEDYIKSTSDYNYILSQKNASDKLFVQSAHQLYRLILPLPLNKSQRLIIVPDGILNRINFEALLTKNSVQINPDYKRLPYLINDFQISYSYSASYLSTDYWHHNTNTSSRFAAFAPHSDFPITLKNQKTDLKLTAELTRNDENTLPGSSKEVNEIGLLMHGDVWLGSAATESAFKQKARNYNILHLSTHGNLDDQSPLNSNLLFAAENDSINDGYLNINEIYNLKLDADLTVLSACNTGNGKFQQGEGAISLSRAFSYAGCPSVIMSLWKIPDDQTKKIMIGLYDGLNQNLPKDIALRNAKLNYLETTSDPLYSHPFYWTGFILMGERAPLPSNDNFGNWILIPLLLLIGLGFPTVRKKIFQSKSSINF